MSIEAMKQMVEALTHYDLKGVPEIEEAIAAGRKAIAEAEKQEPVAWRYIGTSCLGHGKIYGNWTDGKPPKVVELANKDKNWSIELAYTHPPKREWVGLTDADKQIAFDDTQEASGGFWEFADAIEAKLKEKNT